MPVDCKLILVLCSPLCSRFSTSTLSPSREPLVKLSSEDWWRRIKCVSQETPIGQSVQNGLQTQADQIASLRHRWKAFEAVLSCIGSVADELLESGEEDITEVMQHINLDNMLSSVVPQLLRVSGKLQWCQVSVWVAHVRWACRIPVPPRSWIRVCKLFCSHTVREGH